MIILQQLSARPLVVAFSQFCTYRLGMAPTKCVDGKCGGFTVLRGSSHNTLNVLSIACLHSHPNSGIYPMKHFTPLFRKQKLSRFRVPSTMLMSHNSDSDDCRSGRRTVPSVLCQLIELNIFCDSYQPGQFNRSRCPQCGGGSTRERSLIVFIYPDGNCAMWRCFRVGCNWSGITMGTPMFAGSATPKLNTLTSNNATSNIGDRDIRNFTEEDLKLEQISEQIREYFASRQISVDTLQRNGVMQTRRNNKAVIAFTYRRNGKIVNCKYRNLQKLYWQEKNAEKVPYGLDDIKEARAIIIVEGEIDKLSMEEAGYKNCISVPDGAPIKVSTKDLPPIEKDKKYEYLWNFKEYFDQASRIILATDADEPGHALAEELARRLGRERCWRVTWPRKSETSNELCKDANEVLICLGNQALKEVIESAELYIIQGLF